MREAITPRAARAIVAAAVALLLLAAAVELLPRWLRDNTVITSAPVPSGMRAPVTIPLEPGQRACQEGIVFAPEGRMLQLAIDPAQPLPAPALRVTLRAPGYAQQLAVTPAGHRLELPLQPPRTTVSGTLCVENAGRRATALAATADPRVLQRTRATLDGGYPLAVAFTATFTQGKPSSMLDNLGTTAERAATFNALGPWALWLLLPLLAIGVPALLLGAYYLALRRPDGVDTTDATPRA